MKQMRYLNYFCLLSFLSAITPAQIVRASFVVDQVFEGPANATYSLSDTLAQTFTPGLSGILTGFDFRYQEGGTSSNISWDIRSASGTPQFGDAPILAGGVIDAAFVSSGWIEVRGLSVSMSSGDDLAIVLHGGPSGGWETRTTGGYSGGEGYGRSDADTEWNPNGDFLFRTYAVTATPEPTSLAMLGLTLLGAGFASRRCGRKVRETVATKV
jgi:hypothetical protein